MNITGASGRINGVSELKQETSSTLNQDVFTHNLRTSCLNWKMLNCFELLDLREQPANGLHDLIE